MSAKNQKIPQYKTVTRRGTQYYRTRITDADGKQLSLYALTKEELFQKEQEARLQIEDILFRRQNPTVADYCEKWLFMRSGKVSAGTLRGYRHQINQYIVKELGDMYLSDVTADDIRIALLPASKKSSSVYGQVNMLIKSIFYNAEHSRIIDHNPASNINAKGGVPTKSKNALSDQQAKQLIDTVRELPPYIFVMIGLYAGLRREEILGLQWDCVFLDAPTPYISIQRAWRTSNNRPEVSPVLKTSSARRDIPIPLCLQTCLRDAQAHTESDYVISNKEGQPLTESQYQNLWRYISVRTTDERTIYKYVNGEAIKKAIQPTVGEHLPNNSKLICSLDFHVTPHQLRYTYITNLLYAGVDPKTVQYLAGHKNSKTTMDIYAKVKYNKPEQLFGVVNTALNQLAAV